MSGSVMYTNVSTSSAAAARQRARRAAQAAERRRREEARAVERQRRAEARARGRKKEAVDRAKRRKEAEHRRDAEERTARKRAATRRLAEVAELIERMSDRSVPGLGDVAAASARLTERLSGDPGDGWVAEIELLRRRVVRLGAESEGCGRRVGDWQGELESLRARLTPEGELEDPAGHRACAEALDRLRDALEAGETVRLQALAGTVEHLLDRHALTVSDAVEARERAEREVAEAAWEEERQAVREAARQAALAEAMREAADRLDVVHDAVCDAIRDAGDFDEHALEDELRAALDQVTDALAEDAAARALSAVATLEELLPRAESRLDELLLADERRAALARAIQEAMLGHGFAFVGCEESPDQLLLRLERMNGAVYDTTIRTDADGNATLTYGVDGEADIPEGPNPVATCPTGDLLEGVHALLADDGFLTDDLDWDGRPPRPRGRELPGGEGRRQR